MSHHVCVDTIVDSSCAFSEQWSEIAESVGRSFRMDAEELVWLREKPVARLIAAIPFLAGCDQPARTAVAHLGTYILSIRETKPFFNADPTDDGDILDRLRLIMNFRGGDAAIIDKGMALLALTMIIDYERDTQIDAAVGKYNPVASGAFDYHAIHSDVIGRIEAVDCPEMDKIFDYKLDVRGWT
ncbi:MAG: hypothetical protein MI724_19405 [Spirochaetales bacterium]|nr:hypothetical protein [Spirochaetales bacterium]